MSNLRCPGCGGVYNGKKCRSCLYTPMETDLSHPAKQASSPAPKKRRSSARSMGGFLILLALIAAAMPQLRNFGRRLDAIDAINRTPEPIPGNASVLFQQDPVTILIPEGASDTSLWFYNHGSKEILVVCGDVTADGSPASEVSVMLPGDHAVKTRLTDGEAPSEITFHLEIYDRNGTLLLETDPIHWITK